jgi:hypothetical protein
MSGTNKEYGGYAFEFHGSSPDKFLRSRKTGRAYSDALTVMGWDNKAVETCLISFDGKHLHGATLGRRGAEVVTDKYRITFNNFVRFEQISFADIEAKIGLGFDSILARSMQGVSKRMSPEDWTELWGFLKYLRPDVAKDLDTLDRMRQDANRGLEREQGFQIMAQEKDAVGLALDIFGNKRLSVVPEWRPEDGNYRPAPFILGLNKTFLREDAMIFHDSRIFGDWREIDSYQTGPSAVFQRGDEALTIINANRNPIEESLGVDLIYYSHFYDSFVMVQYKRMVEEARNTWVYRPYSDDGYEKELSRMKGFEAENPDLPDDWTLEDYRLHSRAFYWKLCENVNFRPTASDYIKGIYLPLDYWELLLKDKRVSGKRHGVAISRSNAGRHISNTLFVDLVQDGWIGSRAGHSAVISEIIRQCLENGKSVIVAATSPAKSR